MGHKRLRRNLVLSFFAIFICLPVSHLHASQVDIHFGNIRFNANVKSLHELRWNKLTRQGWDMSCGAAHTNGCTAEMAGSLGAGGIAGRSAARVSATAPVSPTARMLATSFA